MESVTSLSDHAIGNAGVQCAGTRPVVIKVVRATDAAFAGITMDQLMFTSLFPHTLLVSSGIEYVLQYYVVIHVVIHDIMCDTPSIGGEYEQIDTLVSVVV